MEKVKTWADYRAEEDAIAKAKATAEAQARAEAMAKRSPLVSQPGSPCGEMLDAWPYVYHYNTNGTLGEQIDDRELELQRVAKSTVLLAHWMRRVEVALYGTALCHVAQITDISPGSDH